MRKILFKAFFEYEGGNQVIYINGKNVKSDWVYGDYHQNGNYIYEPDGSIKYKVIPETMCQCTELEDNKHKDIFEHDICKWTDTDGETHYFEVKYKNGCYMINNDETLCDTLPLGVEVAGNVWDADLRVKGGIK